VLTRCAPEISTRSPDFLMSTLRAWGTKQAGAAPARRGPVSLRTRSRAGGPPDASHETQAARFAVFGRNLAFIHRHNDEFRRGKHTFELATNEYADLRYANNSTLLPEY
jgi:hypothetical protein